MQPYNYQQDCLDAIESTRAQGRRRAYIVMATGLGKTAVAAFEIRNLMKEKPGRVLYLCHQGFILDQAMATTKKVLGSKYTYGRLYGGYNERTADVLFASFQTMRQQRKHFDVNDFLYIIVDETHHIHASTYKPTIDYFNADFMLGLTATPDRMDNLELASVFDGEAVFELNLPTALRKGYLTNVDYKIITDEIQESRVLDREGGRRISIAELNRTIFIPKRDEEIARIILERSAGIENLRMIVFAQNVRHGKIISQYLPESRVIHSDNNKLTRQRIMDGFRKGTIQTVVAINVFNEGVDVPEANCIVFLRSTDSKTIFYQQLGRGLRKAEGKEKVTILDFVANCERIEKVIHLSEEVRGDWSAGELSYKEPLTLDIESQQFNERGWDLLGVIKQARENKKDLIIRTNKELIDGLRKLANELGRTPSYDDIDLCDTISSTGVYKTRFGSLTQAYIMAGLEPVLRTYTRQQLLNALRKKAKELGRTPGQKDIRFDKEMPSKNAFNREFGDLTTALISAGLKPRYQRLSIEILEQQLMKKVKQLGRSPLQREIDEDSNMAYSTSFVSVYGMPYSEILKKYGLSEPDRNNNPISRDELLKKLIDKTNELGRPPTRRMIDADKNMPSAARYFSVFGTLYEACFQAGIEYSVIRKPRTNITKEQAAEYVLQVSKEQGRPARGIDFDSSKDLPSSSQILRAFDTKSWITVLHELGLDSTSNQIKMITGRTEKDLKKILKIKVKSLGRMPTQKEIRADPFMPAPSTFQRVFGSLESVAKEIGVQPNKPHSLKKRL